MLQSTDMKITSWNVNGIRACAKKGAFQEYLAQYHPDILFLQETKAFEHDLPEAIKQPSGYHAVWHSAKRPGYSGVAMITKQKPLAVFEGMGMDKFDIEGRVVGADFGSFIVFGVYFPNGSMGEHRLQYKLEFYDSLFNLCKEYRDAGKHIIVCGDYNTAHTEIDLARPKENSENSGFLPIERAWMDKLTTEMGYVDTFREFNPNKKDQYTWWTYRSAARKRNIGWRIDYTLVNKEFLPYIQEVFIESKVMGSDHCPVGIVINEQKN